MGIATLQDIITKVRKLTGAGNTAQLSDDQIVDYVNSFYLYDFPAHFRSLKLKDVYTFNTQRGIDTYPFDSEHFSTVEAPAFCMNRQIPLFQNSPWNFYGANYNWQFQQNFSTGNGTSGALNGVITAITQAANAQVTSANHGLASGVVVTISGVVGMTQVNGLNFTITVNSINTFLLNVNSTAFGAYVSGGTWFSSAYVGLVQSTPILRSVNNNPRVQTTLNSNENFLNIPSKPIFQNANISRVQNILITVNVGLGNTLNVTDDGDGTLIGDVDSNTPNTINYETGEIQLSFSEAIPDGEVIQIQYNPQVLNIPLSILFFQNQFTLRPVPDRGYTITLVGYRLPSQALLGTTSTTAPTLTGEPEQNEWWETICYGVAKKVYQERLDTEGMALMDSFLKEALNLNETRTYAQLGKQRMSTITACQLDTCYGNSGWGFGNIP